MKLFILCFLLVTWSLIPAQGLEIYVDAGTTSTDFSGEVDGPYLNLTQAFNKVKETLALENVKNETIVIKIKPNPAGYAYSDSLNISNSESKIESLAIVSWGDFPLNLNNSNNDCANLPKLGGSKYLWKFSNIANVTLRGLNLDANRKILIENANETSLLNLCLNNNGGSTAEAPTVISLSNVQRPVLKDLMLTLDYGYVNLVNFTNDDPMTRASNIKIKDITVFVKAVSSYSLYYGSCFEFKIRDYQTPKFLTKPRTLNWKSSQEVNVKNVNVKFISKDGTGKVLPPIGTFIGFDNVNIDSFSVENESFYLLRITPFNVYNTLMTNITRTTLKNNTIMVNPKDSPANSRFPFYSVENAQNLSLVNVSFTENKYIVMRGFSYIIPTCTQDLLTVDGVLDLKIIDIEVRSNQYAFDVNVVNVKSQSFAQVDSIRLKNIEVINCTNEMSTTFRLMTVSGSWMKKFELDFLKAFDNRLFGKLFRFEQLREERFDNMADFRTINISNCSSSDFGLFYFSAKSLEKDPVPQIQWYTLRVLELWVTDNNFTGAHVLDWDDQTSLIEVQNAKTLIQKLHVSRNTFKYFHTVLLRSQVSSIFVMLADINSTTFTKGSFIKTRFEMPTVILDSTICKPNEGIINPFYRFGFITTVTFTNLEIQDTSLITINTPFAYVLNNKFETITINNGRIIEAGDFDPPTCGMKGFTFARDTDVEKNLFANLPDLASSLYESSMSTAYYLNPLVVIYSYMIVNNVFHDLTISTGSLITLEKYDFQQSGVIIVANEITGVMCFDNAVNLVESVGSIHAFLFGQTQVKTVVNVNSLLKLSELKDNKMVIIINNHVTEFTGFSCFIISGVTLNTGRFYQNNVTQSTFYNSILSVDISENNGLQTWAYNLLNGNTLLAHDRSVSDTEDKVMVMPVNPIKISKSVNGLILVNIDRNEGNINFMMNEMSRNTLKVMEGELYTKLAFLLVTIEGSKTRQPFLINDFKFKNNVYQNAKNFTFHKELNGLVSLLLGNAPCVIMNSIFQDVIIESQGNSLLYIASNQTTVMKNTFSGINMYSQNAVFDITGLAIHIVDNTFSEIRLAGVGVLILNPSSPNEGIEYNVIVNVQGNTFKTCKVFGRPGGDMGNILTMKDMHLQLTVNKNTIVDSFDKNPAFYFSNTECFACTFESNVFQITDESAPENRFYELYKSSGTYNIHDESIQYSWLKEDHSDLFFVCQDSSAAKVSIDNLQYTKKDKKTSLRLAQIDSGNLIIKNIEIKDAIYTKDQYVIQVLGDYSKLYQVQVQIKNLTLEDLTFGPQEDIRGVIDFKSLAKASKEKWFFAMEQSKFVNIMNNSVITVRAPEMGTFAVIDSNFSNLKSNQGPAINFLASEKGDSPIYIAGCKFTDNIASQAGGAIFMNPAKYTFVGNEFISNSAHSLGGAIYMSLQENNPESSVNTTFRNNSAQVGNDVVSSIKGLTLEFTANENNGLRVEKNEGGQFMLRNASSRAILLTSLNVSFYDFNGYPTLDLNDNNSAYVTLNFGNGQKLTSVACDEVGCYLNQLSAILSGEKNEIIEVEVEYNSVSRSNVKATWKASFNIELRACVSGEHLNTVTLTCDYCPPNTFSIHPQSPCSDCPINADCRGGNSLEARAGYWRKDSEMAAGIVECRKDGITRCQNGGCSEGFTGVNCEACDFKNGFVENGPLNCQKCESPWRTLMITLGGVILYMLYKGVIIGKIYGVSSQGEGRKMYEASEKGYFVKLLLVYTQILSLLFLFNMELKGLTGVGLMLQIGNPAEFILMNLQCSMMAVGIQPENFIYASTLAVIISPVVQIVLIILFAKAFFSSKIDSTSRFAWLTIAFTMILEQPGLVGNLSSFLSCSHDYLKGDYITLHPSWSCQDPKYLFFKKLIVTPAIVFWAVLIPLFVLISLCFKRNQLKQVEVRKNWGVFYNFNRISHYYWSVIVMILGMAVSYMTYNFQRDLKACTFTLFLVLCGYHFLVRLIQPYKFPGFNFVEGLVFSLLMMTAILGYYTTDNKQPTLKIIANVIIGVLNSVMFIFLSLKVFDLGNGRVLDSLTRKLKEGLYGNEDEEDNLKDQLLSSSGKLSDTMISDDSKESRNNSEVDINRMKDNGSAFYVGIKHNDDVVL